MVAALAACYSPNPSPGAPCGPGDSCPEGLKCSATGLCLVDDVAADGPVGPDGMPTTDSEVPRKRWNIVATAGQSNPTLDMTTSQGGNLILVGVETGAADGADSVTDNANNIYTLIPMSRAVNVEHDFAVEVWMTKDDNGGADKITASGTVIHAVVAWEVENLASVVAVDTRSEQAESTEPTGVNISTTAPGQFILSLIIVENSIDGLLQGSDFTNDHETFGNGWAHLTSDDAPVGEYQPQWAQPINGASCATSVVFSTED